MLAECRTLGGCDSGDAKITKGYNLPAKFVIHTVGPFWHGGKRNESDLLASCYRRSLEVAAHHGLKTIAFPNISTGVYGYPKELAAPIAIKTVQTFLEENPLPEKVIFCIFGKANLGIYKGLIRE